MPVLFDYEAAPMPPDGVLTDVRVLRQGRTWHMGGPRGRENELSRTKEIPTGTLPVFLGSGLGWGVDECLANGRPAYTSFT